MADCPSHPDAISPEWLTIELREADKVVLSRITAKNLGTTEALHVLSFSVAPRRVASAVAALQR